MHEAVEHGNVAVVTLLINSQASLEIRDLVCFHRETSPRNSTLMMDLIVGFPSLVEHPCMWQCRKDISR